MVPTGGSFAYQPGLAVLSSAERLPLRILVSFDSYLSSNAYTLIGLIASASAAALAAPANGKW